MGRRIKRAAYLTALDLKEIALEAADDCYEWIIWLWHIAHFVLEKLWELFEYLMGELPGILSKGF